MAFTQTHIDTLKAAIATGAKSVKYGYGPDAQEVVYRDLPHMRETLAMMEAEVNPSSGQPMRTVAQFNSGL